MKKFSTWILTIFMILFWIFRIIVALSAEFKWQIGFEPFNQEIEVLLLFVTIICIILVIKRKLLGGLLYLLAYGSYFGMGIVNQIKVLSEIQGEHFFEVLNYINVIISGIGLILPIAVMIDLLFDKSRKEPKNKKTDWFYKEEKFDRKLDERADKNNYKTL